MTGKFETMLSVKLIEHFSGADVITGSFVKANLTLSLILFSLRKRSKYV